MENLLPYYSYYKELGLCLGLFTAIAILVFRLTSRIIASENEKRYLKEQLVTLLNKYSNRDSILAKYIYDTKLGIYRHTLSGLLYCHKCLIEKTSESPLKTQKKGWLCPACNSFYPDPDYQPPKSNGY